MSSLTTVDKRYLETVLNMAGGYVQDFSDRTFEEFFNRYSVNIQRCEVSDLWDIQSQKDARILGAGARRPRRTCFVRIA